MNGLYVLPQSATPTQRKSAPQETYRYGNGRAVEEYNTLYGSINVSSVLQQLLKSTGEQAIAHTNPSGVDTLLCYDDTLCIECCSKQVTTTLHSIFSGHRQINQTLKKRKCEGRWIVEIQHSYTDDELIHDVCTLLETMPSTATAAAPQSIDSKGIYIIPMNDGEQWRSAMDKNNNTHEALHNDDKKRPSSMMMSGGALLYVEGPWFYPYEVMERTFDALEHDSENEQCTLIAIDTNEFASDAQSVRHRIAEMMACREMPHVAGVLCLHYTKWSKHSGNIAVQLLPNPSAEVELPSHFLNVLRQQQYNVQ